MTLPALTLEPILKERAWGGRSLSTFGKRLPEAGTIGESWEVADLPPSIPDGRSKIRGGPFDGRTLRSVIEADPVGILGRAAPGPDGGFPLLIKFLDARENLSVQLHPSEDYAAKHADTFLKTEAWIILQAAPGALIYAGVREDIDASGFRAALESGDMRDILIATSVEPGDCVFLESGLCHALGEGIVAAEIQTPSDTTFRVWDWNRNDPNRPLHIEQAMECVRLGALQASAWPRITRVHEASRTEHGGLGVSTLVDCDRFTIERFEPTDDTTEGIDFEFPTNGMPHVFMPTGGAAMIEAGGERIELERGSTAILPAGSERARIELQVRDNQPPALLHAVPPDSLDRTIA